MPSAHPVVHLQQSWDTNMVETSSLNHYQNGYISPDIRSVRSSQSHKKTKRTRPHLSERKNKTIKSLKLKRHPEIGFGFSIRGGIEHGTGIFISGLHQYSDAFSQGLQTGDQILRANKHYFNEVSHEQAVNYIQSLRSLYLVVLSLGITPGSKVALSEYQWIDCYGRPCSPLQTTYVYPTLRYHETMDDTNETAATRFLEAEDERKVNVVVGDNVKLGLLIRGGSEYGLGVFVAGIDEDSVADRTGIMVGEQILEVNGIDFMTISHADAAHIIRTSKMMTLILKDVEKIPLARIITDQEVEWSNRQSLPSRSPPTRHSEIQTTARKNPKDSLIQPGIAGSQLQHHSAANPMSYRWIEEKAQTYLNDEEWSTLKYYLREYVHESITINGLVLSLFDLLDNGEKMQLLLEVRGIVRAQDIDTFDEMVLKQRVDEIEIENESHSREESTSPLHLEEEDEFMNASDMKILSKIGKKKALNPRAKRVGLLKYRTINDESSTMDNITEESLIASENGKNSPLKIIKEEMTRKIESPVHPTYATIKRNKPPRSILRDYTESQNEEFTTFQQESPVRGVENISDVTNEALQEEVNSLADALDEYNDIYSDEGDGGDGSGDNYEKVEDESMTDDYQDVGQHNKSRTISESGSSSTSSKGSSSVDYETNKLGFAFSFLNTGDDNVSVKSEDKPPILHTSRERSHESPRDSQGSKSPMEELYHNPPNERPIKNFLKRKESFERKARASSASSNSRASSASPNSRASSASSNYRANLSGRTSPESLVGRTSPVNLAGRTSPVKEPNNYSRSSPVKKLKSNPFSRSNKSLIKKNSNSSLASLHNSNASVESPPTNKNLFSSPEKRFNNQNSFPSTTEQPTKRDSFSGPTGLLKRNSFSSTVEQPTKRNSFSDTSIPQIKNNSFSNPAEKQTKKNSFSSPKKLARQNSLSTPAVEPVINKPLSTPVKSRVQELNSNPPENDSENKSKPVRYFRDLQSVGRPSSFMDNYQPKSLQGSYEDLMETMIEIKTEEEQPGPLRVSSSLENRNEFDANPSADYRLSNFSVNDIIRQSYLPTTRVEHDPSESLNENNGFNTSFNTQPSLRQRSLNRLSSLNIQNQYQYERKAKIEESRLEMKPENKVISELKTQSYIDTLTNNENKKKNVVLRNSSFSESMNKSYDNRSFSLSNESLNKLLDEPKTYGKPVMTKSPRPEFLAPVNFDSLRKREKERLSVSDENNFYKLASLKRNPNSNRIRAEVITEILTKNQELSVNKSYEEEPIFDSSTLPRGNIYENDTSSFRVINDEKKAENIKFTKLKQTFQPGIPFVSSNVHENTFSKPYGSVNELQSTKVIIEDDKPKNEIYFNIGKDLKAEDTPTIADVVEVTPHKVSPPMGSIQSRMKAFTKNDDETSVNIVRQQGGSSLKQAGGGSSFKQVGGGTSMKQAGGMNSLKPVGGSSLKWRNDRKGSWQDSAIINTVLVPRTKEDPGFTVDVRSAFRAGSEIYISEIQNPDLLDVLSIGDAVKAIDDNPLKKDIKKGLANIIIRNAFNSSNGPTVSLTLKQKQ